MLKTLKKFFAFCGVDNRRLFITSIWLGVVSAICSAIRIPAAAIVIQALLQKNVTVATLWTSLGIIVISLIITIAINMKATMLQTRAGKILDVPHEVSFFIGARGDEPPHGLWGRINRTRHCSPARPAGRP